MAAVVQGQGVTPPTTLDSVAVVMPHFNASSTLSRALDSVFSQSHPVSEVLVVDDASSQQELHAAQAVIAAYDGVRLITLERNEGPAHARNVGWEAATADWVAFLDCDDAWHERKLEAQFRAARGARIPPQMLAGVTVQVRDARELDATLLNESVPTHFVSKRDLLIRNRMSTPSVVVRRDIALRFSANRRFSEDYELWLSIAGLGHAILFVDAPVAAIFKAPYGESGLSSQIWPMITGEFQAYIGARRAGALTGIEAAVGIAISSVRAAARVARLALRKLRRESR